ncbi:MAG: hypothetical protein PSV36_01940 [Algoriphagus sp.]|nr:hypothetical protein [Algoriphagus sp.]
MRKTILTLILGSIFFGLNAQTFKPTVGFNFTDLTVDQDIAQGKNGWQVGASIAFGEKMYVEPGIFYISKSAEFTDPTVSNPVDFEADLNGIRIPLTLGTYLIGSSETLASWRAFGGASGFFVTSTGEGLNPSEINSPSWGVYAGTGLDIWLLFIDLSYEWSVTEIQTSFANIDFGKTNGFYGNMGVRLKF